MAQSVTIDQNDMEVIKNIEKDEYGTDNQYTARIESPHQLCLQYKILAI